MSALLAKAGGRPRARPSVRRARRNGTRRSASGRASLERRRRRAARRRRRGGDQNGTMLREEARRETCAASSTPTPAPPPPVTTPANPPPTAPSCSPASPTLAVDRAAIVSTLRAYARHASLNADEVVKVAPFLDGAQARSLANSFRNLRSYFGCGSPPSRSSRRTDEGVGAVHDHARHRDQEHRRRAHTHWPANVTLQKREGRWVITSLLTAGVGIDGSVKLVAKPLLRLLPAPA